MRQFSPSLSYRMATDKPVSHRFGLVSVLSESPNGDTPSVKGRWRQGDHTHDQDHQPADTPAP